MSLNPPAFGHFRKKKGKPIVLHTIHNITNVLNFYLKWCERDTLTNKSKHTAFVFVLKFKKPLLGFHDQCALTIFNECCTLCCWLKRLLRWLSIVQTLPWGSKIFGQWEGQNLRQVPAVKPLVKLMNFITLWWELIVIMHIAPCISP